MNKNIIKHIPQKPGVYIMKNKQSQIIYIGKAKNLKKRVHSYSHNKQNDPKTNVLIKNIHEIDYITTNNETEALILECSLIKEKQPKYNISLKDNKTYPFITITINETFPRVIKTRKILKDNNLYFGPYTNTHAIYNNIKLIHKLFPIRTCTLTIPNKQNLDPCLDYHIKKCDGPCINNITPLEYKKYIDEITLLLKGKYKKLIHKLNTNMKLAAKLLQFEKAAEIKQQIISLNELNQKQRVLINSNNDIDAFGLHQINNIIIISVIFIREGKLLGKRSFIIEEKNLINKLNPQNAINFSVKNYYSNNYNDIPKEILLPISTNTSKLKQYLKTLKNKKINISIPKIGTKKDLVNIACHNAKFSYIEKQKISKKELTLKQLKNILNLRNEPRKIEGFDISNTNGYIPTAALVSFYNGKANKKAYRQFKIKTVNKANDTASIAEVIARRYSKLKNEKLQLPDLILIDGGKGQVNTAHKIINTLELNIPVISLAKKNEEIFTPNNKKPIKLNKDSSALQLLQEIRDEAHRFSKKLHSKLRNKYMLNSPINNINGVGKIKKQALLQHFKHIENIKNASYEELCKVNKIDKNTAKNIRLFFEKQHN